MIVLNLPIEPIENRYSRQWDNWFHEAFRRNKINNVRVAGDLLYDVQTPNDKFLNLFNHCSWQLKQLETAVKWLGFVSSKREDPIIIFLQDAWFPGIEMLRYIADMEDRDIKICGFLHGGSYLPHDIVGGKYWAHLAEESFLNCMAKIFVGSEYHKRELEDISGEHFGGRFVVTGCPVEIAEQFRNPIRTKEQLVVFPHRLSKDKQPEVFDQLAADPRFEGVRFVKTLEQCKNKMEYYETLARAKVAVSCAKHETFGISMVEAAMLGCYPVVPNALSYPEIFWDHDTYEDYEDLADIVWQRLAYQSTYTRSMDKYNQITVTDKICNEIKGLINAA